MTYHASSAIIDQTDSSSPVCGDSFELRQPFESVYACPLVLAQAAQAVKANGKSSCSASPGGSCLAFFQQFMVRSRRFDMFESFCEQVSYAVGKRAPRLHTECRPLGG